MLFDFTITLISHFGSHKECFNMDRVIDTPNNGNFYICQDISLAKKFDGQQVAVIIARMGESGKWLCEKLD